MSQKTSSFLLFLFFTLLTKTSLYSQSEEQVKKDTNKYFDVIRYTADNLLLNDTNGVIEDTLSLTSFRYDPLFTGNYLYASMGNIGRPHRPLFITTPSIHFTYRVFPMEAYEYKFSTLNIYDVKGPYTKLFYVMGNGKENYLTGVHAQQINNISFGVDFRVIGALGSYNNERSSNTGGSTYLSYQHPKKRYGAFAAFTFNRLRPQENGGILHDTIFEQNTEPNRKGVNTRLNNAQNNLKTNTLYVSQYFNPFYHPEDSIRADFGTIEQIFSYERTDHVFTEESPNPANYTFFLRDTLNTYDSTSFNKATNGIFWLNHSIRRPCNKASYLFLRLGVTHEYAEISDYLSTHYISQIIPEAHVAYKYKRVHEFGIKGAYIANGYSKEGFQSIIWLKAKPWRNLDHRLKISATLSSKMPDYFYSHYHGNNFQWDNNNLVKILQSQADVQYSSKHVEIGVSNITIGNQVFFDVRYQPMQFGATLYYLQGYANLKFHYRSLYWLLNITSTQGNNDTLMAFPNFTTRQSVFFRFPLFESRMKLETGVDIMYLTDYYAPSYVPAIGEFMIQNGKTYGNFLYASYFIGFKVKQFNAMLKIQNITEGLLGYNYMMMPQYPMPDRFFKLAVSWRFYD